jgi:DNA-binding SARP family transcriptional activator
MPPMGPGQPKYRRGDLPCIRGAVVSDSEVIQPLRLMLLGGFTLLDGTQEIELPMSAQRLVAFLALRERGLSRTYLAQALWPACSSERSLADLRTALWRANHSHIPLVMAAGIRLSLRSEVQVDVRALT